MKTVKKPRKSSLNSDQEAIDRIVTSQANTPSAWEAPVRVQRSGKTSLSISGELAARAAFLARLHREAGVAQWVERVVRERVELEERAFTEAKREMAS
ncbi:MAG: hypothetical protein LAP87_23575 [Acidobacteriia bacterium]|nr:hypothetical protein [Terriglobia bacterium]